MILCSLVLSLLSQVADARDSGPAAPGLVLESFSNPKLEGVLRTEVTNAPDVGNHERGNDWALRYTGFLTPPAAGEIPFRLEADTGVRLRVNGVTVVDGWMQGGARKGSLRLSAKAVPFLLEYFFDRGQGGKTPGLKLFWTLPGRPEEAVPASAFSHPPLPGALEPLAIEGDDLRRVNLERPDGGLPLLPGVHNVQVLRTTREKSAAADREGWTFAHQLDLAMWKGRLYAAWGMTPRDEDVAPYRVVYSTSSDGVHWSDPGDLFPRENIWACRFYFYRSTGGRMLAFAQRDGEESRGNWFRKVLLVREIAADHALGPVFTLINPFTPAPSGIPASFESSPDPAFVAACREAVAHRMLLEQQDFGAFLGERRMSWHSNPPPVEGWCKFGKAFCFYRLPDRRWAGLCKMGFFTVSEDEGRTWTRPVIPPSLVAGSGKVWGERTSDGRYALVFNPDRVKRYPLVLSHGSDGMNYRGVRVINGECPPLRYPGKAKDIGLQYVRGLADWATDRSLDDAKALWLVYSINKEDIWVSRVPVPIVSDASDVPSETFQKSRAGRPPEGWNVYSPRWAPVSVAADPSQAGNLCLELRDADPRDHARAIRSFPRAEAIEVQLRVKVVQGSGLELELDDDQGDPALNVRFDADGAIQGVDGRQAQRLGSFVIGTWHRLTIRSEGNAFELRMDGQSSVRLRSMTGRPLQRLGLRTGARRGLGDGDSSAAGSDIPLAKPAVFFIDDLQIRSLR